MLYKLQRAPAVGDPLQIVTLSVGEVIHWIGIPFVASTDVGNVQYTVNQRITEQHVRVTHVNLCTKHQCTRLTFPAVHILKQLQVLFYGTLSEGTVCTRTGGGTLLLGNHLCTLFVDIGTTFLNKPYGKVPQLLEIVAGIVDVSPLESEPLDVLLNALDIFCILLLGVGVIEAEVALSTIFLSQAEVNGDGFGMTDMKVAVRFWRKTGLYPATVLSFCEVVSDHLLYETDRLFLLCPIQYFLFHYL